MVEMRLEYLSEGVGPSSILGLNEIYVSISCMCVCFGGRHVLPLFMKPSLFSVCAPGIWLLVLCLLHL